jgi:hypothetical protein
MFPVHSLLHSNAIAHSQHSPPSFYFSACTELKNLTTTFVARASVGNIPATSQVTTVFIVSWAASRIIQMFREARAGQTTCSVPAKIFHEQSWLYSCELYSRSFSTGISVVIKFILTFVDSSINKRIRYELNQGSIPCENVRIFSFSMMSERDFGPKFLLPNIYVYCILTRFKSVMNMMLTTHLHPEPRLRIRRDLYLHPFTISCHST